MYVFRKKLPMDNYSRNLVIVDDTDSIIGTMKALKAHHNSTLTLHRAFSVFLFNTKGKLLLQKRSDKKLLYPGLWTNTCCSHPFISEISFEDPILDAKLHAIKRLKYEMGISEEIRPEELIFVERMLYKATRDNITGRLLGKNVSAQQCFSFSPSDNIELTGLNTLDFSEYEVDYIFTIKKNVCVSLNPAEASDYCFLDKSSFQTFVKENNATPWLRLIIEHLDVFSFL